MGCLLDLKRLLQQYDSTLVPGIMIGVREYLEDRARQLAADTNVNVHDFVRPLRVWHARNLLLCTYISEAAGAGWVTSVRA